MDPRNQQVPDSKSANKRIPDSKAAFDKAVESLAVTDLNFQDLLFAALGNDRAMEAVPDSFIFFTTHAKGASGSSLLDNVHARATIPFKNWTRESFNECVIYCLADREKVQKEALAFGERNTNEEKSKSDSLLGDSYNADLVMLINKSKAFTYMAEILLALASQNLAQTKYFHRNPLRASAVNISDGDACTVKKTIEIISAVFQDKQRLMNITTAGVVDKILSYSQLGRMLLEIRDTEKQINLAWKKLEITVEEKIRNRRDAAELHTLMESCYDPQTNIVSLELLKKARQQYIQLQRRFSQWQEPVAATARLSSPSSGVAKPNNETEVTVAILNDLASTAKPTDEIQDISEAKNQGQRTIEAKDNESSSALFGMVETQVRNHEANKQRTANVETTLNLDNSLQEAKTPYIQKEYDELFMMRCSPRGNSKVGIYEGRHQFSVNKFVFNCKKVREKIKKMFDIDIEKIIGKSRNISKNPFTLEENAQLKNILIQILRYEITEEGLTKISNHDGSLGFRMDRLGKDGEIGITHTDVQFFVGEKTLSDSHVRRLQTYHAIFDRFIQECCTDTMHLDIAVSSVPPDGSNYSKIDEYIIANYPKNQHEQMKAAVRSVPPFQKNSCHWDRRKINQQELSKMGVISWFLNGLFRLDTPTSRASSDLSAGGNSRVKKA